MKTSSLHKDIFFSIIIPAHNQNQLLEKCLQSLNHQCFTKFEVVIINNNTFDSLQIEKSTFFFPIKLISYDKNLFYSKSINAGYCHTKGNCLIFLNSDVCLTKNYLQDCSNEFLKNKTVDCIWGKALTPDNEVDSLGIKEGLSLRPIDEKVRFSKNLGPTGSCFAITRSLCNKLQEKFGNIMDEEISFFYSDLSLTKRINLLKAKKVFIENMVTYHIRQGSTPRKKSIFPYSYCRLKSEYKKLLIQNRSAYIKKWYSIRTKYHKLPFIIAYDFFIRTLYLLEYLSTIRTKRNN